MTSMNDHNFLPVEYSFDKHMLRLFSLNLKAFNVAVRLIFKHIVPFQCERFIQKKTSDV
jgi:hypothetical protein